MRQPRRSWSSMSPKRRAIATLNKKSLLEVGRAFDLDVKAQMSVGDLQEAVVGSKRATLEAILPMLGLGELKAICQALELPNVGNSKQPLIVRIMEATGGTLPQLVQANNASTPATNGRSAKPTAPPAQAWLSFPTLEAPPRPEAPASSATM